MSYLVIVGLFWLGCLLIFWGLLKLDAAQYPMQVSEQDARENAKPSGSVSYIFDAEEL